MKISNDYYISRFPDGDGDDDDDKDTGTTDLPAGPPPAGPPPPEYK